MSGVEKKTKRTSVKLNIVGGVYLQDDKSEIHRTGPWQLEVDVRKGRRCGVTSGQVTREDFDDTFFFRQKGWGDSK